MVHYSCARVRARVRARVCARVRPNTVPHLEQAGYRAGKTLYGLPYDWRLAPSDNKICPDLAQLVMHVTNTTAHRKVVLVAHSLGNIQLLYCVQRVFGTEILSRIKSLVSIAAPWAGSPQVLRGMFSGAEMVSRYIISDAETRDFARQMLGAYMLMPDERVWGNRTLLQLQGDMPAATTPAAGVLGTAATAATAAAAAAGAAAAAAAAAGGRGKEAGEEKRGGEGEETYTGSRKDLFALFAKVEAMAPTQGMVEAYSKVLKLVDVWKAPPIPVVCIVGTGTPTGVRFGYCDAWPRNMDEEPCALQYEDGDKTVPTRSMLDVCDAWQRQQACFTPLATAFPAKYKSRGSDCVAIEYLHCRDPGMSSRDMPGPGAAHCPEYHATILHKKVCAVSSR